MNISTKLLKAAAGSAGGAGLDVDEVFSTFLYNGDGTDRTFDLGINLSGEGGLTWIKSRNVVSSSDHHLYDTERGSSYALKSNSTSSSSFQGNTSWAATSTGFSVDNGFVPNYSTDDYVSWTFRKAPKFFDVLTYTGDGNDGRTISHNLGSTPGMIIVARRDSTNYWRTWHRSQTGKYANLYDTGAFASDSASNGVFNNYSGNDSTFTAGININANSATYVAYLFAHNDSGDGGFGPDSDQDIIKCGSYTGNGSSTGPEIDLGFEPQWILQKSATVSNTDWAIADVMRGFTVDGVYQRLRPNRNSAEGSETQLAPTSTGFKVVGTASDVNTNGETYIYMAIRRGSLVEPDDATKVFAVNTRSSSDGEGKYTSGFPVDFSLANNYDQAGNTFAGTRLLNEHLQTNDNVTGGSSASDYQWDHNDGLGIGMAGAFFGGSTNNINWMWKRARGYFDVVAYTGTGSARTVAHNLGVAPEMMWMKCRSDTEDWAVYHNNIDSSAPEDYGIYLNDNAVRVNSANFWNDTAPTSSVFTVGTAGKTNGNTKTYIAYLFATVAGVSKVGNFTISGSDITVDCGFSSGARFVLIKRSSGTDDWYVFDTVRGYVSGSGDAALKLNSTAAESSLNMIDPHASGFSLRSAAWYNGDYIFYAVS